MSDEIKAEAGSPIQSKIKYLQNAKRWGNHLLPNRFFGFLLVTFFVGIALLHPPLLIALPHGELMDYWLDAVLHGELRPKLGDAVIIAGLLSILLDRYLKLELLREVARDVLSFAAGHDLPPKLKAVISQILRQPYVRENFKITMELKPFAHSDIVRLQMKTEYVVRNLTNDRQRYRVRSAIEKSYVHGEESAIHIVSVSQGGRVVLAKSEPNLPRMPEVDGYIRFSEDVDLLPLASISVETLRSAPYRDSYFYVLDFLELTQDVVVQVITTQDYDWNVVFGATGTATHQGNEWRHPGTHLPGQYVRVIWNKKSIGA